MENGSAQKHNSALNNFGVIALYFSNFFCPECNFKSIKASDLNLHRWIDIMMEICNAQLYITYIYAEFGEHLMDKLLFCDQNLFREHDPVLQVLAGTVHYEFWEIKMSWPASII